MLTVIFWKKTWAWLKHYWYWPAIIVLLVFSIVTGSRAKEELFELLLKQKENYEKELQIIKKTNKEKDLEKNKIFVEHKEELERIEEDHNLKLGELGEAKQKELIRTIEENKDSPDKLAEEIAKILRAEYYKKHR